MTLKINIRLIIACLVALACMSASALDRTEVRIMTYNLRAGQMADLDTLSALIKSENPDFVALQEVDVMTLRRNCPLMNGLNMVNEIAKRTGMFGFFARTLDFAGGYYGIAILSKYPSVDVEKLMLPNPKNTEPRTLLKGRFEMWNGKTITFACTHLDVEDATTREEQADFILDSLLPSEEPVILCGDLNGRPEESCISRLKSKMKDVSGTEFTFPSDEPDRKIDYIFVMSPQTMIVESTKVINHEPQQSDHRPVFSVVSF